MRLSRRWCFPAVARIAVALAVAGAVPSAHAATNTKLDARAAAAARAIEVRPTGASRPAPLAAVGRRVLEGGGACLGGPQDMTPAWGPVRPFSTSVTAGFGMIWPFGDGPLDGVITTYFDHDTTSSVEDYEAGP